jgi:hypothetical protein
MMEPEGTAGTPGPEAAEVAPKPQGGKLRRRQERQDDAPLLVEVAWLVIEAATAVSRLSRTLARL